MARGIAICTCAKCGETFQKSKTGFFNTEDAHRWEEWAVENCTTCYDCYQKEQLQKGYELVKELNLPALTGKSEKQIAYAETLRAKFVIDKTHFDSIDSLRHSAEYFEKKATERGMSEEERATIREQYLLSVAKKYSFQRAYAILYESDAGKLIDALRY